MAFQISEKDLDSVIDQVQAELTGLIKTEAGLLAKGEGSGPPPVEGSASASSSGGGSPASASTSGGGDGAPPSDGGSDVPPGADAGGPPAGAPPDAGAPPSADPAAGGAPGAGSVVPDEQAVVDEPDVQRLQAEMLQMPPKHLEAIFLASKAALEQMAAGAPGAGASAPAPSPAGASPAGAPPVLKAELGGQPIPPTPLGGGSVAASGKGQPIPPTSIAGSPQGASASTGTTQSAAAPAIGKGEESASASGSRSGSPSASASGSRSGSPSASASKDPNGREGNAGLAAVHAAMKGEQGQEISTDARANGGAVAKSETEELRKHISDLEAVVEHFLAAPLRKSMSGVSQLEYVSPRGTGTSTSTPTQVSDKVAGLNKNEITAILSKKTAGPLSKADRQSINGWYEGTVNLQGIAHLLDG